MRPPERSALMTWTVMPSLSLDLGKAETCSRTRLISSLLRELSIFFYSFQKRRETETPKPPISLSYSPFVIKENLKEHGHKLFSLYLYYSICQYIQDKNKNPHFLQSKGFL